MQGNPKDIYIKNPSAATVSVLTIDTLPEVNIDNQIQILQNSATACTVQCASPCVQQIWTITFKNVEFGTCNDCGKSVGFGVRLQRNPNFDNQTYLEYAVRRIFVYQGQQSGTVTAATLATYFEEYIENLNNQPDQHDLFGITAVANGNDLVITLPCTGLVTYEFENIYQLEDNNLLDTELPDFVLTQQGQDAFLSKEKMLKEVPLMAGHVFGEAPKDYFTWCETSCVIMITGCISACDSAFEYQNSNHLHSAATPFQLKLIVNSAAPGYGAFIAALNAAITPCILDDTPGSQTLSVSDAISAAPETATLDMSVFTFPATGGLDFSITNGATTVNVFGVADGTALASALTAAYPGGTFTFNAPPTNTLVVTSNFATSATATSITLSLIAQDSSYGE